METFALLVAIAAEQAVMSKLLGISSTDGSPAGNVLLERVQQVKAAFVSAAVAEADSRGSNRQMMAHRRELIDAYRESKVAILDSISG